MNSPIQYNGYVDILNKYLISGWAVDKDNFANKISVDLVVNNKIVATCAANNFREDLKIAEVSDGYAVFDFCPFYWLMEEKNDLRIVYSGTDKIIPNGQAIITGNYNNINKEFLNLLEEQPKISIVLPVFNTAINWLKKAIQSVQNQIYENWELCIVDDASTDSDIIPVLDHYSKTDKRIQVLYLENNQGVSNASNKAVEMATGEYLSFLDHDDELFKNALYELALAINNHDADIIYSDELMMTMEDGRQCLHFKPDFSPDLLLSHNYITHLLCVKKTLFKKVGGFSSVYDGAQDYDLILKLIEQTKRIHHIPKLLYIWRRIPSSISKGSHVGVDAIEAGLNVLKDTFRRRKTAGSVEKKQTPGFYTSRRKLKARPLVSIITPNILNEDNLQQHLVNLLDTTYYPDIEFIGIYNKKELKRNGIKDELNNARSIDNRIGFYECDTSYNYFAKINFGVKVSHGEHIILMDRSIKIINRDWIEAMLEHSQRDDIGAIGAKIYYPDDTLYHAGYILGLYGIVGHSHHHSPKNDVGYFHRLVCVQNISAVSCDLLMIKNNLFKQFNGMNSNDFNYILSDIDLCLRFLEDGYLNVFTPHCEARKMSNYFDTKIDKDRQKYTEDIQIFKSKWQHKLEKGDTYYNSNLTTVREDFTCRHI